MRVMIADLQVPGEPQGKQRPKWSPRGTYTPKKTVNYETYIQELFAVKYPDFEPVECTLQMNLAIWLMIPSSASKKKKQLMEAGKLRPKKRPDNDNVLKVVMDALEKLAYKNDSQIVDTSTRKYYSKKPSLDILIYRLEA